MYQQFLQDVESRGQLAYNNKLLKTHTEAEAYARKNYPIILEREWFVAGWNMAYWIDTV